MNAAVFQQEPRKACKYYSWDHPEVFEGVCPCQIHIRSDKTIYNNHSTVMFKEILKEWDTVWT